ncbi:Rne/Rng family ribonuclease [Sneathiella marina]|uniref:Rne/Rng family ribonuclease n=1 Tax=Sneathiella marina TaxID=2950108 RepID=A0ABY4W7Y9_9PROT|nr:Rne/Rng family ribonuclease [Sneathiella marina]USG62042.1 Rne/Rng family ribonuclease [Sneathiella marina]
MRNTLLIEEGLFESRAALLREDVVIDLRIERAGDISTVGDFYFGRISKILHDLDVAFVDLGGQKHGFLQARDIENKGKPIAQVTHEGQKLLVQVSKDELWEKNVQLTCRFTFKGVNLIYQPLGNGITFSRKIREDTDKERIRAAAQKHLKTGGLTIRTSAKLASDEQVSNEAAFLSDQWSEIQQFQSKASKPGKFPTEKTPTSAVLTGFLSDNLNVVVNSANAFRICETYLEQAAPNMKSNLTLWNKPTSLFEEYGIEEEIERASQRRVDLDSGVSLSFDQTEALLIVDVNSSSAIKAKGINSVALSSNLEAASEIARQIRLRNSSGIIIIDFIQMNGAGDVQKVSDCLKKIFKSDPIQTRLIGMTELGLMQVTRKRTRKSLQNILTASCAHCAGTGRQDATMTSLSDLVRTLQQDIASRDGKAIRIDAGRALSQHLLQHKVLIENYLSRPLAITENADLPNNSYQLG